MKIYCILFDMVPRDEGIRDLIKSKGLHYGDFITNSWTATTLSSMFTGVTPSELFPNKGIGYEAGYKDASIMHQILIDSKMIFNILPSDWNIHIHSMGPTRGDTVPVRGLDDVSADKEFRFVPDEICNIHRGYYSYTYDEGNDEKKFISKVQKYDNEKENHFIFLKYNDYHDAKTDLAKLKALSLFKEIIGTIDFKEKNSLFWVFSDHGIFSEVDKWMKPPHSWLSWCSVTDNITKNIVTKDVIYMTDFYNTVFNRINLDLESWNKISSASYDLLPKKEVSNSTEIKEFKFHLRNYYEKKNALIVYRNMQGNLGPFEFPNDVLHLFEGDRIYVCEDGRRKIDKWMSTTVSAIKKISDDLYLQAAVHRLDKEKVKFVLYNKTTNEVQNPNDFMNKEEFDIAIACLVSTLNSSMHWKWYFNNSELIRG